MTSLIARTAIAANWIKFFTHRGPRVPAFGRIEFLYFIPELFELLADDALGLVRTVHRCV
jgi:hypothetical protein